MACFIVNVPLNLDEFDVRPCRDASDEVGGPASQQAQHGGKCLFEYMGLFFAVQSMRGQNKRPHVRLMECS